MKSPCSFAHIEKKFAVQARLTLNVY